MSSHASGRPPVSPLSSGRGRTGPRSAEDTLRAGNRLLRCLTSAQSELLRGQDPLRVLPRLLAEVMDLTDSSAAVLGELVEPPGEAPLLKPLVLVPPEEVNASWPLPVVHDASTRAPRELRSLLGAIVLTGQPVLVAGSATSPALLGVPLVSEGVRTGLMGLAWRPGSEDPGDLELLQPFFSVCADLLLGWRNERRRSQADQELRHVQDASAARLQLVMDTLHDGVWDLDMSTGHVFANHRWLGMLGYADGELELTTHTWTQLIHPDDKAESRRRLLTHMEKGTPFVELEQRLRRKDGSWAWILSRAQVLTSDAQGYFRRMVGINVDITARKIAEQRLSALVDVLPDMAFRIGADGIYRDYYAHSEVDLLVPAHQLIGFSLRQLPLPPAQLDKLMNCLGRSIRDGSLEIMEYLLPLPRGARHYEIRFKRCGPDEAIAFVRDISERKASEERLAQQEEQLRRQRDSLEALVRSRNEKLREATLELEEQQAQLVQTEKLASLGQMAAGVAHEINNPVSYVMSNLGTLDQYVSSTLVPLLRMQRELLETGTGGPSPDAAAELLGRMRELWEREDVDYLLGDMPELIEESLAGTRRIKEIAQSLRSFSREDSGEPQLVDVNAELASTLKIVWNELKYKCEVKRDFGPLPPVSCHPTQIAQVFTNLLVNAAQSIPTRGEIRIRTRHEGSEVVVEIADTGQGMSPETISKLFTPFFTTKPRGQGTGLGLSVSYGIITRHKGRIEVQSELGKGSTFTVRLPAAKR